MLVPVPSRVPAPIAVEETADDRTLSYTAARVGYPG
jgi:hypothetical protein